MQKNRTPQLKEFLEITDGVFFHPPLVNILKLNDNNRAQAGAIEK